MDWLVVAPVAAELLWGAAYARRFRRWQAAREEVARRLGRPVDPAAEFEHLLVYLEVVHRTTLAGGDGVDRADRDDLWAKAYAFYHLPVLVVLRVAGRPVDFPLLAFNARAAVTMAGTAAAYAGLFHLLGRLAG